MRFGNLRRSDAGEGASGHREPNSPRCLVCLPLCPLRHVPYGQRRTGPRAALALTNLEAPAPRACHHLAVPFPLLNLKKRKSKYRYTCPTCQWTVLDSAPARSRSCYRRALFSLFDFSAPCCYNDPAASAHAGPGQPDSEELLRTRAYECALPFAREEGAWQPRAIFSSSTTIPISAR